MKTKLRAAFYLPFLLLAALRLASAQTAAPTIALPRSAIVVRQGLRSTANHGSFKAARYAPDGSLLLLYDGGDGVRLLRTDPTGRGVLGEVQEGAAGDVGIAMALDPAGNIYVAGTSLSGTLTGTAGAAYPAVQDSSLNSFVAKFDSGLHLQFLTFLGAGKTAATGVAATAGAVFVTGTTFGSSFPTTAAAALPHIAPGSSANGFVERFSPDGSALVYSTLLTGAGGDSESTGIAADVGDHAYVVGETSSASFPAVAALIPVMPGSVAGFFLKLTPAGDAVVFSSFVPGSGLTGIDLDPSGTSLLLSGNVATGQFPVANASGPLANTPYQSLLRWSADGTEVLGSTLLVPGTSSQVTAAPDGTAWVSGSLAVPLFGYGSPGDGFFAHVNAQALADATGRTGGMAVANANFATLVGATGAPAIDAAGLGIALPGTLAATVNATPTLPRFDVPLTGSPDNLLPELPVDLLPTSCTGSGQCLGSAGLLTILQASGNGPSLSLSTGSFPLLTLRNEGSADATGVVIGANGYNPATDCGGSLPAGSECGILLSGTGPGTLTVTSAQSAPLVVPLPAIAATPKPLFLSASELDFGIVTASSPGSRTVTLANVGATVQSFASMGDGLASAPPYTLAETGSTCAGTAQSHTIPANSSCTLTFGLTASAAAADDGPVHTSWQIAGQDLAITAVTQAADLSVSSAQIDFGTTFAASAVASLPRYLFLSNSSASSIAHASVPSPANGPFTVLDECPGTLEPASVCRLTLTYAPVVAPSVDSMTLSLDGGLNVLVTGEFLAGSAPAGDLPPSPVQAAPAAVAFTDAVTVTGLAAAPQVVTMVNGSAGPVPLGIQIAGDFTVLNPCGPTLAARQSCQLAVQFTPSQPGLREGLLSINTGSGSATLNVAISGVGGPLLPLNNGLLSLGSSSIGEPVFAWYKVSAALESLTANVSGAGFRAAIVEDDGTGHGTLPASAFAPQVTHSCRNCWLGLVMVPGSTGGQAGNLTLSTVAGGHPYQLTLDGSGTAVQGLVVTPSQADLGTVPVGSTSAPFALTLANLLSPNAAVSIVNVIASGDFHVDAAAAGSLPCAGLLQATSSCRFAVSFSPTAAGRRKGSVTIQTTGGSVSLPLSASAVAGVGLAVNPTSLSFDNAASTGGPRTMQQSIQLTNVTGGALTLSPVSSTSPGFTPSTNCSVLQAGATCTITVSFTPGSSEATGSLHFSAVGSVGTDASSTPFSIPLSATYSADEAGLILLPDDADFGAQAVGSLGQIREFTLRNASTQTQTIMLSPPQNFPLATPFACGTLQSGDSCTFSLGFLPEVGGALTGSVLATGAAANGVVTHAIGYLLGYGNATGQLTITGDALKEGTLEFGQVTSGQSVQQILTMTNSGDGPLNIRRIAAGPPFSLTTTCGMALDPGAQCQVAVSYAPLYGAVSSASSTLPRTDAETLTIASDAVSSPDEVELLGSAIAASAGGSGTSSPLASYTLSAGALTFPNTAADASSPEQAITVQNTGTRTLTFAVMASPVDYVVSSGCVQVQPGASCAISVSFEPRNGAASPVRAATLAIQSNALDALEFVSLLGLSMPTPLSVSGSSLNFGVLSVGDTASLQLSVTNLTSLPISPGTITATGDYTVQLGTCPASGDALAADATCTLLVEFAPTARGSRSGVLTLAGGASTAPLTVSLSGVGTAPKLEVSPGSLNFGSQQIGTQAQLPLSLTNSGSAPLNGVTATLSGPGASDFAIVMQCALGAVATAAHCTLGVHFTPTEVGSRSATLTLTSNDPSGPVRISLTGTGTPAAGLNVTVNGSSTATLIVKQGGTANFSFAVTPLGGFQGPVTLACTSESSGPYAACSLLETAMTLTGETEASTGSLSTSGSVRSSSFALGALWCALPLLFSWSRTRGRYRRGTALLALTLSILLGSAAGCGGPGNTGAPLTPRGTYQYEVTATAAGPTTISSSAVINLIVQ